MARDELLRKQAIRWHSHLPYQRRKSGAGFSPRRENLNVTASFPPLLGSCARLVQLIRLWLTLHTTKNPKLPAHCHGG
ncbi:MAG: hypothetical protein Q7R76_04225 [Candidatus Woesearchaeota archaeon]|nr:hypothetical protein [Candidatus Woesearchaeota archaeon]